MVGLSPFSLSLPLSVSLFSSPKILPSAPTLADLQTNAESLTSSAVDAAQGLRGRLPLYTSASGGGAELAGVADKAGREGTATAPATATGRGRVKIPSPSSSTSRRGVEGESTSTGTKSTSESESWFITPDPCSNTPPPAYTATRTSTSTSTIGHQTLVIDRDAQALAQPDKLRKTKIPSGYKSLQSTIPGESPSPPPSGRGKGMEGSKVYAESVMSQPSISDMQYEYGPEKASWWEWMTCRA